MATRYLLDTNICIYIQRERPPEVLKRFRRLKPGDAAISVVTWGELRFGAEKSQQRQRVIDALQEFITLVPVLPLSLEVGEAYGHVRTELERVGKPIGNNDLWIAAHALAENLILVSNNLKEFSRIAGLKCRNWA